MNNKIKCGLLALLIAAAAVFSGCKDTPNVDIHGTTASADAETTPEEASTTSTEPVTDGASASDSSVSSPEVTDGSSESSESEPDNSVTEPTVLIETDPPETTTKTTAPPETDPPVTTTEKPPAQPSPATVLETKAPGTLAYSNDLGCIDYSNAADGYIMVKYTGKAKKVKVQVTDPGGVTQTYNLNTGGSYEVFPLSGGNGSYSVLLAENISGTSYAVAAKVSCDVKLMSQFEPFLRPNQYVNYSYGDVAVTKASELCAGTSGALEKVDAVYSWLVENVSYDKALAENLGSGYLPDASKTINKRIGICLDYAGTAAAMLRSQNVPTKLVVGYAGTVYHAWISVYVENVGWVHGAIYFDGTGWKRMDPTFDASGNSSDDILSYIGTGSNYKTKYLY